MRKFFIVLVWGMGLGLAALFTKDIVRGVRNVIAINHFTPTEVNNAPIGWHQDLGCYLNQFVIIEILFIIESGNNCFLWQQFAIDLYSVVLILFSSSDFRIQV